MGSVVERFRNFFRNLKYLSKYDLEGRVFDLMDNFKYEIEDLRLVRPKILSPEDTLRTLLETEKSFARFGDGEFQIIRGQSIPFQSQDPVLARRLRETIQSSDEGLMIGLPRFYFYYDDRLCGVTKHFFRTWVSKKREEIKDLVGLSKQYYDAVCSQMYVAYDGLDFGDYFERVRDIWRNRRIAVVCGETVFDRIEDNIFNSAAGVEYIFAPRKNAFASYKDILERAMGIDRTKLVILILGPTAAVLACDLHNLGYRALDLGHIAKDYQYYLRETPRDRNSITAFFAPD